MNKIAVVAIAAATVLGAGACNKAAGTNPQLTKQEAQAQKVVQTCASKANFITKGGRQNFYACLSHGHNSAEVQTCATKALTKDGVLTKSARRRFEADLANCVIVTPKGKK